MAVVEGARTLNEALNDVTSLVSIELDENVKEDEEPTRTSEADACVENVSIIPVHIFRTLQRIL